MKPTCSRGGGLRRKAFSILNGSNGNETSRAAGGAIFTTSLSVSSTDRMAMKRVRDTRLHPRPGLSVSSTDRMAMKRPFDIHCSIFVSVFQYPQRIEWQ